MNSYRFFKNINCKYYPCHKGIDVQNCLFCFCPLYTFDDCGGNYSITKDGIKDCENCLFPHRPANYDKVLEKLKALNTGRTR
ncbi:MAG: metal-binding protein [Spirochaetales bacterium]|nr:metal-binding protein [Spirochaetales bacterium]